ncbi:MAG: hypothetical protein NTV23_04080 [Propionibacteriales bacterium]|nr:hypothetical protein [Propionibacteriales bacterium]
MTGAVLVLAAAAALGGCGAESRSSAAGAPAATPTTTAHAGHPASSKPVEPPKPLRADERRVTLSMPAAYTPSAPTGVGTDDYRCFLLDPEVARDAFVTGFDVRPGNPSVVHHVILFRVPPQEVQRAEQQDARTPGQGWTCFGNSGLTDDGGLDDAPWLGAWAPGGTERLYGEGLGAEFPAGSRIVMQVHYNLLAGTAPDASSAELRISEDPDTTPLETVLLPAPVELPCRAGRTGPLCDRAAALKDVQARFGTGPGSTANLLHLLCGSEPIGPIQSCTRTVQRPQTIRGVAGHMHLLGEAITIRVNRGTDRELTVLNIPVWNFDDQGSTPKAPIALKRGDTVTVTCRHSQRFRDLVPSFEGQPERYVIWGEGSTDEMCLGILLVTRP